MYGMRGYRYRRPYGYGWHRPRPFMFIFPVMLLLFFGFVMLKFLWPLLLIGIGIALFKRSRGGDWGHSGEWGRGQWGQDWHEKFKNELDDKPKHDDDDRRYTQTADGDWVEIV